MRLKHIVICLGGFFMFGASAFAVTDAQAPDNAVVKKTSSSAKSSEIGVEKVIAGPIASVNVDKNEIVVERNGKQYSVLIDGSTQIVVGNTPVTLDKLKAGEIVSVSYRRFSDGSRIALTISNKSSSAHARKKTKAELKKEAMVTKSEAKAEESAASKVEVKAEAKKEAATKAEVKTEAKKDATAKAEVKAEAKKDAAAKAEVKADAKKDATAKAEVKAETKKDAAAKAEVKAETKKDTTAKAEVKAEAKKDAAAKAEVKAEAKKDAAVKAEVKAEAKKDSLAAQPVKAAN